MSALPSPLQNQQGPNDVATDPSMEEILASIRRIIADDHGTPINPRPSRSGPAAYLESPPPPLSVAPPRADLPKPRPPEETLSVQPTRRAPVETLAPRDFVPPLRAAEPSLASVSDRIARLETAPAAARPALRHSFDEPAPPAPVEEAAPEPVVEWAKSAEAPAAVGESLLSPLARASVTSAFEALTVSMSVQNSSMVENAVRDMLRPMLKEWLDDNLPVIVERLVRAEIERVARGGRS